MRCRDHDYKLVPLTPGGNPVSICLLKTNISNHLKQKIAAEMSLSETAFVLDTEGSSEDTYARRQVNISLSPRGRKCPFAAQPPSPRLRLFSPRLATSIRCDRSLISWDLICNIYYCRGKLKFSWNFKETAELDRLDGTSFNKVEKFVDFVWHSMSRYVLNRRENNAHIYWTLWQKRSVRS